MQIQMFLDESISNFLTNSFLFCLDIAKTTQVEKVSKTQQLSQ